MRPIILIIAAAALILTGCYKEREDAPVKAEGDTTSLT